MMGQPAIAGAIVAGGKGTAADKYEAFENAGVRTVKSPAELGSAMNELLKGRRAKAAKLAHPAGLGSGQGGSGMVRRSSGAMSDWNSSRLSTNWVRVGPRGWPPTISTV